MQLSVNELKNGAFVSRDGEVWQVMKTEHNYRGRGAAFVGAKMRNVRTGRVQEMNFRSSDMLEGLDVEAVRCQFLYRDDESAHVMDSLTFDQFTLPIAVIGHMADFFKEGDEVMVLMHEGEALAIRPPQTVRLKVVETEMAVKGDTATKATKPARMESGVTVLVPLFVKVGDTLLINPEKNEYIERVN